MDKKMFEIECSLPEYYNYAYHLCDIKLVSRLYVKNMSRKDVNEAKIIINSDGIILPKVIDIQLLPAESTIEIDTDDIKVNTSYLINNDVQTNAAVKLQLSSHEELCATEQNITVLPYQCFPGVSAPKLISCFVRPQRELAKIIKSACDMIKGCKMQKMLSGYENNTKEDIRLIASSLFAAIQKLKTEKLTQTDIEKPLNINFADYILPQKKATPLEMVCLYASCLEYCGINSAVILSGNNCFLSVWLKENCFLESFFDDITEVKKRYDSSVDDICVIDINKLYTVNAAFYDAENAADAYFSQNSENYYTIVDIGRCRLTNCDFLPSRKKSGSNYQLAEEDKAYREERFERKRVYKPLKLKPQPSKEAQWERRLLDLSLKNNLLNFIPKTNVVQIMSISVFDTVKKLLDKKQYDLLEVPSEFSLNLSQIGEFNTPSAIKPLAQLITLESKNGKLRTFKNSSDLNASLYSLYHKEKTASEETGTCTLYAACGFLKWKYSRDNNNYKYAPLILLPISISKKKGGRGYSICIREEEYQFNITLSQLLKQEFGIEMRGTQNIKTSDDIDSILATVKKQILSFKGWEVTEDVYIASLSFSRFVMWYDLHNNREIYKKNKIIDSLCNNKLDPALNKDKNDDAEGKRELYIPISADSSQQKAVKLSDSNMSFVLHGPPGTGKSQTITNIIANAIAKNKRVLFVAQKLAALEVVKKRLDAIGIGDFCLELHSSKTAKSDVCKKLIDTLSLKTEKDTDYKQKLKEIAQIKDTLKKPVSALHQQRRLGISIYEGILNVLKYKDISEDLMKIDSIFYDRLNADKLKTYENLLAELVSVSRECGQIYSSPFTDVGLTQFDSSLYREIKDTVQVLKEEGRHLNTYAEMCFRVFNGRPRQLTGTKHKKMYEFCVKMSRAGNSYNKIFENIDDKNASGVLNQFIKVYKKYEEQEREYDKYFRGKVALPASYDILREELEIFPVDYYKSKLLKILIKKINKAAAEKPQPQNLDKYIEIVLVLDELKHKTAAAGQKLSALIGSKGERVNYHRVADFIMLLDNLFKSVSEIINDYDTSSFNVMLENMFENYPQQVFSCYANAYTGFEKSFAHFCKILNIEADYYNLDEDFIEYITLKAEALRDNLDMLDSWCRFNRVSAKLNEQGLKFVLQPLIEGKVSSEDISGCFKKKIYTDFVRREIISDDILSKFVPSVTEEKILQLKLACEEFENITQKEIRYKLIKGLPDLSTEGPLSVELMQLQRAYKSNMKGSSIRNIILQQSNLFSALAPCLLMSPATVCQYLGAKPEMFDIVIFDEASQITTAEALAALSRSKNAIIVGDPKQLPPTSFFSPDYYDDEYPEYEDLESVLEDCLALGLKQRYLKWHYRSKHESLIAFSNAMYYDNKLCTFPSTDALHSKVSFKYIENGVYDRGGTRQNKIEADSLVTDIVNRLKTNSNKSIGVVTFSIAQQSLIEKKLSDALIKNRLEAAAYDREEPLFVKNLESVQGDERDIILFSVCYGPDRVGRLSMNFGPVNREDGWRRLNVAVSRAREEMVVYSSITSAMIDLSRNNSKGIAGVKAFLEFAKNGKSMLALKSRYIESKGESIGKYIAAHLEEAGYECRYNLGVSDFKIDTAVLNGKGKFILAILCDSKPFDRHNTVRDNLLLQTKMLKRLDWNVMRLWTVSFYNNPKREINKVITFLDKITGKNSGQKNGNNYLIQYTEAEIIYQNVLSGYILNSENEKEIKKRLEKIIEAEQPIAKEYLIKRCLFSYGITRMGSRIAARMDELCQNIYKSEETDGVTFFRKDDFVTECDFFRVEKSGKIKRLPAEISPYEYTAAAKSILEVKISQNKTDLIKEIASIMKLGRVNNEIERCVTNALKYAANRGILTISVNDTVTM